MESESLGSCETTELRTLHLFGAPEWAVIAAPIATRQGWSVCLRTSDRYWTEPEYWTEMFTEKLGVSIFVNNDLEAVTEMGPPIISGDIGLSFGAPWVFPDHWIEKWNGSIFNFHPRALPFNRGAGGSSWLILMKERSGAVVVHEIVAALDAGPIVASRSFSYPEEVTLPSHYDAMDMQEGARLLEGWLPNALAGSITKTEQSTADSSYWPRLSTEVHGWVDWRWTAEQIVSFICAFDDPYPGAKTYLGSEPVVLRGAQVLSAQSFHPFQAGLVYRIDERGHHVSSQDGGILIKEIISITQLGVEKTRVGARLRTPLSILEEALATRVTYHPNGEIGTEPSS